VRSSTKENMRSSKITRLYGTPSARPTMLKLAASFGRRWRLSSAGLPKRAPGRPCGGKYYRALNAADCGAGLELDALAPGATVSRCY